MHAPSRPRRRMSALAGLLAALTLAGCTEKVTGIPLAEGEFEARQSQRNTPGGAPAPPAVPFARGQEALGKQYAAARAVDPCALHDPAAAAKVTGLSADSLMPDSNLSDCDLSLTPEGSLLSVWNISAAVGKIVDSKTRAGATPEQIGGATYLRAADTTNDGRSCRFFLDNPATGNTGGFTAGSATAGPTPSASAANPPGGGQEAEPAPRTVIELSIQRRDPKPQAKDPCQVGREYLAEIGKYWAHPALRADKLTTPELRLAQADPCGGLAGVGSAMGGPIEAAPTGPYSCTVRLAANSGDATKSRAMGSVSATFSIKWDPMLLMRNEKTAKEYTQITIAGRPALQKQAAGDPSNPKLPGSCAVTAVVDENVAIHESLDSADAPKSLQVVETRANTCELATAAAESVIASIR